MLKLFAISLTAGILLVSPGSAQEPKPMDRVIGTVSAVDHNAHTVAVKEDKTGTVYTVDLANTRTLLKVEPTAKDLKNATRITADDLEAGDRVQVGGSKAPDNPNSISARSVILMSARELQEVHQQQAAAWQHSTPGLVTAVDPSGKLTISTRTAEGQKSVTIQTQSTTEFTRYSPDNPKTPQPSQLADIHPGDQLRVIGDRSEDGSTITAQRIYSGPFRTLGGTVASVAPDNKSITIKNAGTNQVIQVSLNEESAVHKLPPDVAMRLAMRLNPSYRPVQAGGGAGAPNNSGNAAGAPPYGAKTGETPQPASSSPPYGGAPGQAPSPGNSPGGGGPPGGWQRGAGGPGGGMRGGDMSQIIERLPKIEVSELKPGDVVLISGVATTPDNSQIIATNIISGAEPILRAAPTRQGQSSLGDWGTTLGGGGMDMGMPPL